MSSFASCAESQIIFDKNEPVINSIFKQYERVVINSIITSFGLDFIIKDRHGGDVDTIHNVRLIGTDPDMTYKNADHQHTYENLSAYNSAEYHSDMNFKAKKREAKEYFRETGSPVEDAYTGEDLYFLGRSKGANPKLNAELDHVISAKSIHIDRGRVLANISGVELANSNENLEFTNKSLNASMGEKEIPDYLNGHPEIDKETKNRMSRSYDKAKKSYEHKLAASYYMSSNFFQDVALSSGKVAIQMGLRQALGFVFTEIWFSVKEEFERIPDKFRLEEFLTIIGNGIKRGIERAKKNYKEILDKLKEGVLAGALSSITTTLCNIFFTTAKNVINIIRQTWASVVEAIKILLFNPDRLPLGERIRAAVKLLAVGASVVAGTIINEMISKSPIATVPVVGEILQTFCGTLVTGILSCTLLYFLDRSEYVQRIVIFLNSIPTTDSVVDFYKCQAAYLEEYAAQVANINVEKFREETAVFEDISVRINDYKTEGELLSSLLYMYKKYSIHIPWTGDFDSFMADKSNRLVFE